VGCGILGGMPTTYGCTITDAQVTRLERLKELFVDVYWSALAADESVVEVHWEERDGFRWRALVDRHGDVYASRPLGYPKVSRRG
jgi:hypothetical protein